jgi:hypothetical protein
MYLQVWGIGKNRPVSLFLLVLLFSQLFLLINLSTVQAQTETPTPMLIGAREGRWQTELVADGSTILWIDRNAVPPSPDRYILGYDFATTTSITVNSVATELNAPAISGSIVAWVGDIFIATNSQSFKQLKAKDLKSGYEYIVVEGSSGSYFPAVSGNTIVWIDNFAGKLFSTEFGSGIINTIVDISTGDKVFAAPAISNDLIVWLEFKSTGRSAIDGLVRALDRKTGKIKDISKIIQYTLPKVSGRQIILSVRDGGGIINFDSGVVTKFNFYGMEKANIFGNYLIWMDRQLGCPSSFARCIRVVDLRNSVVKQTVGNLGADSEYNPVIAGDYLAWIGYKAQSYNVYALPLNQALITLTPDEGFLRTWNRTDKPVEIIPNIGRSYLWGPQVYEASERYTEKYNNADRKVQYFQKARMEINNPKGDANDPYYVTTGLLVKELVTGLQQNGDTLFEQKEPSSVPIAGDPDLNNSNPNAPTYASFRNVVTFAGNENTSPDLTGKSISQIIDKSGKGTNFNPPEQRLYTAYDTVTKHNIADVFVNFGKQSGLVWNGTSYVQGSVFFDNPTYVLGRPVTEAYWVRSKVGGVEKDVLVQLFERRVLTYTPSNPESFKVEMGNVGQHYFCWRYSRGACRF